MAAYDDLFRSRADWTRADLILICQAASAIQTIRRAETEMLTHPLLDERGRVNPLLALIDQQRGVVQRCLRDAGLRGRDGSTPTSATPAAPASTGTVTSFESWLK